MSLYAGIWKILTEAVFENYPVFVIVIVSEQWEVTWWPHKIVCCIFIAVIGESV